MTGSLVIGCLWVLVATGTAFLPMRRQYPLGIMLLIAAPFLIVWIGYHFGWFVAVLAFAAFVSMFRRPFMYFYARARGQKPELPR
ncbi:MAG: DUF2484 family protein [Yoonia sp.]|nr:DUF2484 family protein [Yoonia sp.]